MFGFSRAVSAGDYRDPRPVTVNLHMERVVERIHRKGREVEYVQEREVQGDRGTCAWCGRPPVAEVGIRRSREKWLQPFLCEHCLEYATKRKIQKWYRPLYPKD